MEQIQPRPLAGSSRKLVTARLMPNSKRPYFFRRHFRTQAATAEYGIYRVMDRLCPHYRGGYWEFYDLSNGGALLVPTVEARYTLACAGNGYSGSLAPLATGIGVCAMAFSEMSFWRDGQGFGAKYVRLRDFLVQQPEAGELLALLD